MTSPAVALNARVDEVHVERGMTRGPSSDVQASPGAPGADGHEAATPVMQETTLRVAGMYCAACSTTIEAALRNVDGVDDARVSASAERATVRWDARRADPPALVAAIRRAGYDAAPDAAAPAAAMRKAEGRQALWRLFVAWFCMMQVMMMATPSYVARPGELADDLRQLLNWGAWVLSVPVVWWSAAPFFKGAWRSLRGRRIGMDVPVALGVAVTFVA